MWSPPAPLNSYAASDAAADSEPAVAAAAGVWIAAWQSAASGSVFFARSTNGGRSWSRAAPLSSDAGAASGSDSHPRLVGDAEGHWVAVWETQDTSSQVRFARSEDGGRTWSEPASLDPGSGGRLVLRPDVATDGAGSWIAAWLSGPVTPPDPEGAPWTADILVSRSVDQGATWSAPVAVVSGSVLPSPTPELAGPRLAAAGGAWVIVWGSLDPPGGSGLSAGSVWFVRSTDAGVTWTGPATVDPNAAAADRADLAPVIATDGEGTLAVAWESRGGAGDPLGADADLLWSFSSDGGASWSQPLPLHPNAASDAGNDGKVDLAHGAGVWIATWESGDALQGRASFGAPDVFVATTGLCGDGIVAGPEECDAGGAVSGGCCDAACHFEPADTPCDDQGGFCTVDDRCDGAGHCIGTPVFGGCRSARRSVLRIVNHDTDLRDRIVFKWLRGAAPRAEFGDPVGGATDLTLCVLDAEGLVSELTAPAQANCGDGPCWALRGSADLPRGLRFVDRVASPPHDGLRRLSVRWDDGVRQRGRIVVQAAGEDIPALRMSRPLHAPVTAQLVASDTGACWGATFGSGDERTNDGRVYRAVH